MCETCGCSDGAEAKIVNLETGKTRDPASLNHGDSHHHAHLHDDGHFHDHVHDHDHIHSHASTVLLERDVLAKNAALAARNRAWFAGREILALNLVSGPGAGKTTLLERTVRELRHTLTIFVIEGDQATTNDSLRIRAAGAPVSRSIQAAVVIWMRTWSRAASRVETIVRFSPHDRECRQSRLPGHVRSRRKRESCYPVGNGGDDKPIKYPHMFQAASLLLINKIDLLPYVEFDLNHCQDYARQVNPAIEIMTLSATTGEGLENWFDWISAPSRREHWGTFPQPLEAVLELK